MQMELSHKRARVELERAAGTSARRYEVGAGRWAWLAEATRWVQAAGPCFRALHGACVAIRQVSLLAGSPGSLPFGG